jgi:hypothetical protein
MLKLFRMYNKWILAVGACFLMVAFLVDPSMWAGSRDDRSEPIGTANGRTLTVGEQRHAANEMAVLQGIGLPVMVARDDHLAWLLMKTEAQAMGIDTSYFEVDQVLALLGIDDRALAQMARSSGASTDFVREAVRSWITIQQYRELVLGLGHVSLQDRLTMYLTAVNLYQQAGQAPEFIRPFYLQQGDIAFIAANGRPRISDAMMQRMAMDQLATVSFTALVIPAGKALGEIEPPTDAKLRELFETYKDRLPSREQEASGLPFGYRTPDRVRLEYLAIPLERLRGMVTVDESEALDHYEANKNMYRAAPPRGEADLLSRSGELQPYEKVRAQIIGRLTDEKAAALADRIVRAARAMLLDQARTLREVDGYRDMPADWQPMPLSAVAEAIQRDPQYGILPDVLNLGDRWLDGRALMQEPGIGRSATGGNRPIGFAAYALSTREINPDSPLAPTTRLQVGMPSTPLQGLEGTRYLFRLTAAEPTHSPESLDEVRDQVESDARRLAAFELLQLNRQDWLDKALAASDWAALAESLGVELTESGEAPRREFAGRGQPQPPLVDGIGRSPHVIDAAFEKGYALSEVESIADAPLTDRVGAAGSEPTLSLVIFRVDGFTPIPRSRYEREASSSMFSVLVNEALQPLPDSDTDLDADDPLSTDAIRKRLNYVSVGGDQN